MQGHPRMESAGSGPAMKVLTGGRQTSDREGAKKLLADYIAVLEENLQATGRGDERGHYQQHLAAAARMYAALAREQSGERLHELLAAERRGYGLALLFGPEGEAAAAAFAAFAAVAEKAVPAPIGRHQKEKEKMKAKEANKRYELRFELFPPHEDNTITYQVFTTMGPPKAIVIATQSHLERKGDPIHRVMSLKPLTGEAPRKLDLVDRLEF